MRRAMIWSAVLALPLLMAAAFTLHGTPATAVPVVDETPVAAATSDCCLDPACPPGCSPDCPPDCPLAGVACCSDKACAGKSCPVSKADCPPCPFCP